MTTISILVTSLLCRSFVRCLTCVTSGFGIEIDLGPPKESILFNNYVHKLNMSNVIGDIKNLGSWVYNQLPAIVRTEVKEVERIVEVEMFANGKHFIRLAGLSGGVAVAMAAYGAHVFKNSDADPALKEGYSNANHFHLIHSVALLAVPMTRRPLLVGTAMSLGIIIFSGTIYIHALTGSNRFRALTPYGGMLLIFSWLAMII